MRKRIETPRVASVRRPTWVQKLEIRYRGTGVLGVRVTFKADIKPPFQGLVSSAKISGKSCLVCPRQRSTYKYLYHIALHTWFPPFYDAIS